MEWYQLNHWYQWFFNGFSDSQPSVTMVFDGCQPLVQQCDSNDTSPQSSYDVQWRILLFSFTIKILTMTPSSFASVPHSFQQHPHLPWRCHQNCPNNSHGDSIFFCLMANNGGLAKGSQSIGELQKQLLFTITIIIKHCDP